jgi:hypothetical protein
MNTDHLTAKRSAERCSALLRPLRGARGKLSITKLKTGLFRLIPGYPGLLAAMPPGRPPYSGINRDKPAYPGLSRDIKISPGKRMNIERARYRGHRLIGGAGRAATANPRSARITTR